MNKTEWDDYRCEQDRLKPMTFQDGMKKTLGDVVLYFIFGIIAVLDTTFLICLDIGIAIFGWVKKQYNNRIYGS